MQKKLLAWIIWVFPIMMGISHAQTLCIGEQEDANCKKHFATVIEAQLFIEEVIAPKTLTIGQNIPYSLVYQTLEQGCDEKVIAETKKLIEPLKQSRGNVASWKIQTEMQKRFSLLIKMIAGVKEEDEKLFCKQKYLLYSLLERTQEEGKRGKEEKGGDSLDSENSLDSGESFESGESEENGEQEHGSAEIAEETPEKFSNQEYLMINNVTKGLETAQDWNIATLAPKLIQREIGKLISLGFLEPKDLEQLEGKIQLEYVRSCGSTKGSYRMTQNIDGSNRKVSAILLNVNLCETQEYLKNFERYVRQIFIHELGHFFYYFKDKYTSTFGQICRKEGKNWCSAEQFVSSYAMQNLEEDYAETFAHWYLGNISQEEMITDREHGSAEEMTAKLQLKNEYFGTLWK